MKIEYTEAGWVVKRGWWIFTEYLVDWGDDLYTWVSYTTALSSVACSEYWYQARDKAIEYEVSLLRTKLEDKYDRS